MIPNPGSVVILRATPIQPDPRVEKIGRALSRAGYNVRALGWDRVGSLPALAHDPGFPVERLAVRAAWARGLGNLPALLRWQAALLAWLARQRSAYRLIHACDFDTLLPALWARRLWGKRVIYDLFDLYADMLRATPRPIPSFLRRWELAAIGKADALLLADDARHAQIAGACPRRSAVIYNSPEDCLVELNGPPPPPGQQGGRLRLAYVGLLQLERGLLILLDILADHPEWQLDLAGFGAEEAQIAARARQLPNVTYHGRVPYDTALRLNAGADALPALYDPAIPNHRFASPNKLFESMMLARPVLAARGTSMDRIVDREGCGLVVEYGSRPSLEDALRRLEDPDLRASLGANGRRAYQATYSWECMTERLLRIYREVEAL